MPSLAIGILMKKNKGFTLIEIMVVMMIIMIITTIAVLALGHLGQGRRVAWVAETLKRNLIAAQQEAILRPAILGLKLTSTGYEFFQWTQGRWVTLTQDKLSQKNAFKDITVTIIEPKNVEAYFLFLPGGVVSPFHLILSDRSQSRRYQLKVTSNGAVQRLN